MWRGGGSYPRDCGLGCDWCVCCWWGKLKSGVEFEDEEMVLAGHINSCLKVVDRGVRMWNGGWGVTLFNKWGTRGGTEGGACRLRHR